MKQKLYGLIGRKLGHSLSVPVHNALGNPDYRLFELEPEALGVFLEDPNISGLNVTIPYKRDVIPYCQRLSPEAESIGSVNTLVYQNGMLIGYNTDLYGFEYMASKACIGFDDKKVLVFGSGGASLAVQAAAKRLGARDIIVISRSGENNYHNLERHYDADILINATPLGMYPKPGGLPADPALFPKCSGVLDLVYAPRRTAFLQQAEKLGIAHSDGLSMLVAQAKAAEELFFNRNIPDSENLRILKELRRDTENIVLIGMPGSGKSTVGKLLSKLTGREAVDIDAEIEGSQGMSIPDIFAKRGEAFFRQLEREQIAESAMESGKIIITGGGVVTESRNYSHLHQNGRIYQLMRETSSLATQGRPLSQWGDPEHLFAQRQPMYQAFCDVAIDNNGLAENAAEAIWRDFCENSCY